ncbi:MAG: DUF4445 domain-containing protein [Candidatus Omnitrophica bacterium]|nr:DUF4445 domain-containing protein [Candidatus Omnitrophota bacterium]
MLKYRVKFQPEGKQVMVKAGISIREAAESAGIVIDTPCGVGNCGKCAIQVVEGDYKVNPQDLTALGEEKVSDGFRLSCIGNVESNLTVLIPEDTRLHTQKILSEGEGVLTGINPTIRKVYLELEPPSLSHQVSDWQLVKESISPLAGDVSFSLSGLREMSAILRQGDFKVTAVLDEDECICLEPGKTDDEIYGICFDIGTTTVVGAIIDLKTGKRISHASRMNAQVAFGDDVITRIAMTLKDKKGLEKLHSEIIKVVREIIEEACAKAGISPQKVYQIVMAGNTVMHHLFLGIPPASLSTLPYNSVVSGPVKTKAKRLGLEVAPSANLKFLPNIRSFVGADTVGVILASGIHKSDSLKLAVDIGTNGQVMLGSKKGMLVTSTSAGPAFEGAHISCGMRASEGAIEAVEIKDGKVELKVIGGGKPRGICGSGLIDAVAGLVKIGIVDENGYLEGEKFVFYKNEKHTVELNQRDIREVQLAKGSIRAAIKTLMNEMGVSVNDISEVLLAGAFGNYIRKESALRIGLLPDVPFDKIKFIGNAALAGAKMALCSKDAWIEAERISNFAKYVELGGKAEYQTNFAEAMFFTLT